MLTQILPVGEEISQWICPFRTYNNEFKTVLVPFALSSPEVLDALFAASFHRLAYYGRSEFNAKAETFKSSAITGLMNGSGQIPKSEYHQLAAIAVVIVLIYDDMISAQDYFRNLTPVLVHLITTVDLKSARNQTLARFLEEQLGLLLILVLPYMAPDDKTVDKIYRFLEKFAMADGGHKSRPSLAFCLRQSVTVWLRKVKDPNADVDGILEDMRWRLEYSPDLPSFDHYLTWVYFNCAASASKKTLRDFFTCRLNWHTTTFGFKNVSLMVDFLQVLWENEQTWPSLIQFHNEYICA
ncbi:unnamed protein product [Clonostachys solani]|uniref:Uncharacterized protein n=1 Tax=Clonostachys solani TaxID=160281 RepID=A0A9N9ZIC0_9HYPO|nr:unnamed protein product [Clonostachys solani]